MARFNRVNTRAAKLGATQVADLRDEYDKGATQGELARKYNMSIGQIGRIVRGESWRGVPPRLSDEEAEAGGARLLAFIEGMKKDGTLPTGPVEPPKRALPPELEIPQHIKDLAKRYNGG